MKALRYFSILIVIHLTSCSDLDPASLVEAPPHLITSETLYKDMAGFEAGLNGLYSLLRDERTGGNDFMLANMMVGTDNMVTNYTYLGFEHIAQDWGNINNPNHLQYLRQFTFLYKVINTANTIINRAENAQINWTGGGSSPEQNKNRVVAEARAIRAWAYRHLTYGWGDVPISTEESSSTTIRTDWERTPVAQVRNLMLEDWEFAEQHIASEPSQSGRITKGAVQTFLSELYLTLNNPERALFWANKAIEDPAYSLITSRYGTKQGEPGVPFMDMFTEGNENRHQGNKEALWVWNYALNVPGGSYHNLNFFHNGRYFAMQINGVTPFQLTVERGGRGVARMSMTKWALELYEPQDDRGSDFAIRKYFVFKDAQQNAPFPADILPPGYSYGDTILLDQTNDITPGTTLRVDWPYSRKAEAGSNPSDLAGGNRYNDFVYLRLAETYLLKAEAQLLMGDRAGAAQTLNIVRKRSNASEITADDVTLDFILDERSRELVLEEDRRWTLLRTGKWLERTRKYNKNGGQLVAEKDQLFPIPQAVIDANLTQTMPQNPGY